MGRITRAVAGVLVLGALGYGCSSGEANQATSKPGSSKVAKTTTQPTCEQLSDDALSVLRQGLRRAQRDKITLKTGSIVALPNALDWPLGDKGHMWAAAVKITDGKHSEVDTFALSDVNANGGLIFAIGSGQNWFTYGAAVEFGSPVGDYLNKVMWSDEAEAARECASV
jgi:hypothetical protein